MNAPGDAIFMSAGCRELSPETFDKPCFESTGVLCCEEVIALPFCSPGVTFRMDCRESKLLGGCLTTTWDQTVVDTWIRSHREPGGGGGAMVLVGCHQEGALGLCRDSALKMYMDLFPRSSDLVNSFDVLCSVSGDDVPSLLCPPGLFYRDLSQPSLPVMWVLDVTGVRFDVSRAGLLCVAELVRSCSSLMRSDDTGDGDWFPLTTATCSWGDGSRCMGSLYGQSLCLLQSTGIHAPSCSTDTAGGVYQDCVHSAGIS